MSKYNGGTYRITSRLNIQRGRAQQVKSMIDEHPPDLPPLILQDVIQTLRTPLRWVKAFDNCPMYAIYMPIYHTCDIPTELGKSYESGYNCLSWNTKTMRNEAFSPTFLYNGLSTNRFINLPTATYLQYWIDGANEQLNITPQYIIEAMGLVIEKRLYENIKAGRFWPLEMFTTSFARRMNPLIQPYVFFDELPVAPL